MSLRNIFHHMKMKKKYIAWEHKVENNFKSIKAVKFWFTKDFIKEKNEQLNILFHVLITSNKLFIAFVWPLYI